MGGIRFSMFKKTLHPFVEYSAKSINPLYNTSLL